MYTIDLNCDLGESFGNYVIGNDNGVFPYLSSCNIACGFHGGDPYHIELTIDRALEFKVKIGAHPSYPDLMGFGRRKMVVPFPELSSIIKYQVGALKAMTESKGGQLGYVKTHGALYNSMVQNIDEAKVVVKAIKSIDPNLAIMGLANSGVKEVCDSLEMRFIAEAFADRRYTNKGTLVPRSNKGAVISKPKVAAKQVLNIILNGKVQSINEQDVNVRADSICIHGDNPNAVKILKEIHTRFLEESIAIQSFVK